MGDSILELFVERALYEADLCFHIVKLEQELVDAELNFAGLGHFLVDQLAEQIRDILAQADLLRFEECRGNLGLKELSFLDSQIQGRNAECCDEAKPLRSFPSLLASMHLKPSQNRNEDLLDLIRGVDPVLPSLERKSRLDELSFDLDDVVDHLVYFNHDVELEVVALVN